MTGCHIPPRCSQAVSMRRERSPARGEQRELHRCVRSRRWSVQDFTVDFTWVALTIADTVADSV